MLAGMPMPMRRCPARAAFPALLLLLPMLLLPRAAGAAGDVRRALQFTGGCEPVVSLLGGARACQLCVRAYGGGLQVSGRRLHGVGWRI